MSKQEREYMTGFGSHFSAEAIPGALPDGQNSPQKVPYGLYAEQLSGTAFTAPRAENRHSWVYKLRPSAGHTPYNPYRAGDTLVRTGPFNEVITPPNRFRWDPPTYPEADVDFVDGIITYAGNGDPAAGMGSGVHYYAATKNMDRAFVNADGEMLIVPQEGRLGILTELGELQVDPLFIAVIPRGMKFRVRLLDGKARGYVCENYGPFLRLPELGPIGSNCLANPRDFEFPVASFEEHDRPVECIQKFNGALWQCMLDASPFDVVAWHGNLAPYRYDLKKFNAIGSISYDHPDPSIYTVLTSPSGLPGTANIDFVIFPPRWMVAEHTFRPPWFHRNIMAEFMGLIHGVYDSKEGGGFEPGGASLHNPMTGHGPDKASYEKAVNADLEPQKIEGAMAFMFESSAIYKLTRHAWESPERQRDYDACWAGFTPANVSERICQ